MMNQFDSNPTSHLPLDDDERTDQQSEGSSQRDTEFGDIDSIIELQPIDQQPPDDVAEASALQPTAEDRYVGCVIAARTTLEEVRATLNQPEYTDCEKLRMFLPILVAAKGNLSNTPPELTQETIDEGKRVLGVVDIIHLALAQLPQLHEVKDISSSQHDKVRWLNEEYIQIVKENYENICVAEELVEDQLAEESMILMLKEIFLDSIAECRDELDHIHLTEVEEPSTSTASAAGGSHYSPGSSGQGAEKRKLNYLTSHSSDFSKRFCSGDTDADF